MTLKASPERKRLFYRNLQPWLERGSLRVVQIELFTHHRGLEGRWQAVSAQSPQGLQVTFEADSIRVRQHPVSAAGTNPHPRYLELYHAWVTPLFGQVSGFVESERFQNGYYSVVFRFPQHFDRVWRKMHPETAFPDETLLSGVRNRRGRVTTWGCDRPEIRAAVPEVPINAAVFSWRTRHGKVDLDLAAVGGETFGVLTVWPRIAPALPPACRKAPR